MTFKSMPKDRHIEVSRKGAISRRSPETAKAWAEAKAIKAMYSRGVSTKLIAERYKIDRRQVYRVINGD